MGDTFEISGEGITALFTTGFMLMVAIIFLVVFGVPIATISAVILQNQKLFMVLLVMIFAIFLLRKITK